MQKKISIQKKQDLRKYQRKDSLRPKLIRKKCPHCRGLFPFLPRHINQCQSNRKECQNCGLIFPLREMVLKVYQVWHQSVCKRDLHNNQRPRNAQFRIKKSKHNLRFEQGKKTQRFLDEMQNQQQKGQQKSQQQVMFDEPVTHIEQVQNSSRIRTVQLQNRVQVQVQEQHTNQVNRLLQSGLQNSQLPNMRMLILQLRQLTYLINQVKMGQQIQQNIHIDDNLRRIFRERVRFMQIMLINNIGELILQHLRNALDNNFVFLLAKKNGFSQSQIQRNFPLHQFKTGKSICPVCMEDIVQDCQIRELTCTHIYHSKCIDPWLKMKTTCPTCRMQFQSKIQ